MDLAPFPCGRLPGFRRAIPSTPLDAYCYVWRTVYRRAAARTSDRCVAIEYRPARRHGRRLVRSPGAPGGDAGPGADRRAQPADAGDRQPVRDDGLRPPQEPRRLRAARPLRRPRRGHRGPRPRHRAVPRGRLRGLRRGRRVRRRRHRQRGRQRPGRVRHAAVLPARRPGQRLLPHAGDPRRRRRRDRASAGDGLRLEARAASTSAASTTATSPSRPGSAWTPAWSRSSTPTRG